MSKAQRIFEDLSKEWDERALKYIPFYNEMVNTLISTIPFDADKNIKVLDLGCGTGEIGRRIKEKFPVAVIECVDMAANMIDVAKNKLSQYADISFQVANFTDYSFDKKYDVIFSSLAIHHLEYVEQKQLYEKIYNALSDGGIFIQAEYILGANEFLKDLNINSYYKLVRKNLTQEEFDDWIKRRNMHDIDRPVKLAEHFSWMQGIGFKDIDVVWKKYQCAVFCGTK